MRQLIISLTVVFSSFLSGCDLGSQPTNQPSTATVDGVTYTLSLERVVFASTDSVKGRLVAANITSQSIRLQFPNQHQLKWRLLNGDGKDVLLYPTVWFPAFSYLDFPAGEEKNFLIRFALTDQHGQYLTTGTYRFEASLAREESPYLQMLIHVR